MSEHAQKRLFIVAAIVTILSAIWYALKPSAALQVVAGGSTVSPGGRVSDPVLFGVAGSPDQVESLEAPTAAAVASVTGAAAGAGSAESSIAGPGTAHLYYNLAPRNVAAPVRDTGCGCGPRCGNNPTPAMFTDGQGSCLSSTYATLQRAMEACIPGYLGRTQANVLGGAELLYGAWE